ncbi:hypothetical protein [Rhodohalobacter barkolensis]|uniref:Uncharacterized protein n=1 Tax=Rhodohalobacter barkolensis TaxID=2053187 RepID=A0A2N0VEQ6_9BACT|nr:hypothetical protein [Rhodohalobacter barkolensis]PKD42672.1 hypothetical protein CWD77_14805 [Rhodohalobacter barkolensis]
MSFHDFDDGPIWNEFQWESHLNEIEKRSEQLRRFITSDPHGNTPRWLILLQESIDELDAVETFIEEELLLDDAYFPEDEDDWEDEEDDEWDDDDFFLDNDFPFDQDEDFDDYDSGEDWKELSEDYTMDEYGSIENLAIYKEARNYAVDVLKWGETISPSNQSKAVHDFVSNTLIISAKLAGGYSFGFDLDVLGGNIAYTKKALFSANEALNNLQKLKKGALLKSELYYEFHNRLFEIRNDIGIYIQELRERFDVGME